MTAAAIGSHFEPVSGSETVLKSDLPSNPYYLEDDYHPAAGHWGTADAVDGADEIGGDSTLRGTSLPTDSWDSATMERSSASLSRDKTYTNAQEYDLPALQTRGHLDEHEQPQPVDQDDPSSYDLIVPEEKEKKEAYSLEKRSQQLFSKQHLQVIFSEPSSLLQFTTFLSSRRPHAIPILIHYLDALKSLRAIHYANAMISGLDPVDGLDFTNTSVPLTRNEALEARASAAFDYLVREELPAYITHQYTKVVSITISARISGSLPPHLRDTSEGLAEVFCLTDPSRPDNPIVFASEEFNRTTQYGMGYILGRNCRFLQGPWTDPASVRRIRENIAAGKAVHEVFLNYRRDGSPFMNLLMCAPLCDSQGRVRYFIGAQVDVSGLVRECAELESLQYLLDLQARGEDIPDPHKPSPEKNDELRELSEMLNQGELSIIRRHGGKMHREIDADDVDSLGSQPRLMLKDPQAVTPPVTRDISGKLGGVYQHYLLVRPYPSLRILFASPSQRVPGILQSPFMSKIGGSDRVRQELTSALAEGRGVTAKVRWVSKSELGDDPGRNKWIHCTPLVGSNSNIGVWMVVVVDDDKGKRYVSGAREVPPVAAAPSSPRSDTGRGTSNGHRTGTGTGEDANSLNGSINSFRIG